MNISVEIPQDLHPAIKGALARGGYANEQELVSDILRAAFPALEQYQQLRDDVQASLAELEQDGGRNADFNAIREQLCSEYDELGNRK